MKLKGKTALITGAAQGIGAQIGRLFAAEGAEVFICDLQAEQGEKTAAEIRAAGGKAHFQSLNVAEEASWTAALDAVVKTCGRLDILVNNAGINIREPIEEMKVENFDKMLAVNVKGPFIGIKHAIPILRKGGGGSIINMSSICGLVGHKYTTEAYTITKGALTLMTKTVGVRYAKDNIRCNSIHPSTVYTPLVEQMFKDPEKKAQRFGEIPLGRLATAEDVAGAALFLASGEAAFLNGVALPVDGGLTAY
ncbi:MAG: SDR family oxidoreductase [Spirochaetales bacterium]|jgi:NAD(P)-dependent dehydrogenase (short-subunit alcohol dehydrogenase family)|nr:SDR family oxidoreductase [Spirochaetales bacterium]